MCGTVFAQAQRMMLLGGLHCHICAVARCRSNLAVQTMRWDSSGLYTRTTGTPFTSMHDLTHGIHQVQSWLQGGCPETLLLQLNLGAP